jgi:hypothetical protein
MIGSKRLLKNASPDVYSNITPLSELVRWFNFPSTANITKKRFKKVFCCRKQSCEQGQLNTVGNTTEMVTLRSRVHLESTVKIDI